MNQYRRVILFGALLIAMFLPLIFGYKMVNNLEQTVGIKQPDIILITIDTCRADALGSYGNSDVNTHALDRFSQFGIQFIHGYSPIPTTGPAHTSLLTGLYPSEHRVLRNAMPYSGQQKTIQRLLKDSGYATGAFVSGYSLVNRVSNLGNGFDVYDDEWSKTKLERGAEETTNVAIDWIKDQNDSRFFCWIHYFDPHSPYNPPEPINKYMAEKQHRVLKKDNVTYSQEKIDNYNRNVDKAQKNKDFMVLLKDPTSIKADPEEIFKNWTNYLGEVSATDQQIYRLWDELSKLGILDRALVILTSDHGEGFDHDYYFGHGDRLFESSINVPWIVKYPLNKHQGRLINDFALHVDLFPTIKSLSNCDFYTPDTRGKNLNPLIEYNLPRQLIAWTAVAPPLPRKNLSQGLLISAADKRYKLISNLSKGTNALFDLQKDPGETVDVSLEHPEIKRRLDYYIKQEQSTGRFPKQMGMTQAELDEINQLRQLGYVD